MAKQQKAVHEIQLLMNIYQQNTSLTIKNEKEDLYEENKYLDRSMVGYINKL